MNKADLKKEIIEDLLSKVKAVVSGYREKWDEDLVLLLEERTAMENLEAKKAALLGEQKQLRPLVNRELTRINEINRKFHKIDKAIVVSRKEVFDLTSRLTSVPPFQHPDDLMNFLSGADFKPSYADALQEKKKLSAEREKLDKKRK